MLVLTIDEGKSIDIDGPARIKLIRVRNDGKAQLGFTVEKHVNVLREDAKKREPGLKVYQGDDECQTP